MSQSLSWFPEVTVRLSLQHSVSRRSNTELSAGLCVRTNNVLLPGSLERKQMDAVGFFWHAPSGLCLHAAGSY